MSKARILLVGAGQLGSRHLQALALLEEPASIQVVDPSDASLETARQRWSEAGGHDDVKFLMSMAGTSREVDVAIVATSADVRRRAIETMLDRVRPSYAILEKVLFQHPDDFDAVAGLFANKGTRAWVNCPRRMWPFYQELKSRVKPPVHMEVNGTNWGLACNAIHLIDLFAYLTGGKEYLLTPSFDEGHTESKRAGFIELTGALRADFGDVGEASMRSLASGETPFVIIIEDAGRNWKIEEGNGRALEFVKNTSAGTEQVVKVPFQSQLTNIVVTQLLSDGECPLTPYGESWALHLPLLYAISEHLHGPGKVDRCPIT